MELSVQLSMPRRRDITKLLETLSLACRCLVISLVVVVVKSGCFDIFH